MPTPPLAYLPGILGEDPLPLGRFLPPLPAETAVASLERAGIPAGDWVLDPFGSSPRSVLEAARSGRRMLVSAGNPVLVFLLETLAAAPQPAEFQSALAALSATKRGEERLETHLRALYRTPCANCGEEIEAEAFLWRRGETAPYARLYRCPRCRDEGERPLSPSDHERLAPPGSDTLHRSRALARVAGREDEHYPAVEEALTAYLPRPLYALQTLINKVEGPGFTPAQRHLLQALLLSACDAASTLWPVGGRTRPRQLATPPQFRENNLWLALEEAAASWSGQGSAVPLVRAVETGDLSQAAAGLPATGGILLFSGRARGLPSGLFPLAGGLAIFPRPNQAFWTLSALWAGWLWGREAALPLHPQLGRRRYDWNWHAAALHSPLSAAARLLSPGAPLIGLMPELAPGFLAAVLTGAATAGLLLEGLALRSDEEQAQAAWSTPGAGKEPAGQNSGAKPAETERIFAAGAIAALEERAEPSQYLPVYAAGLEALARQGALPGPFPERAQPPGDLLTRIQTLTGRVFSDRSKLRRFETGSQEDERSLWWLPAPPAGAQQLSLDGPKPALPLADRVEMELVRLLQRSPGLSRRELDTALCRIFTGLLTPPAELISAVLESYAEDGNGGGWKLQAAELPAARRADLDEAREMLRGLGTRMGYSVSGETPVLWTPGSYGQVYYFYVIASSVISRHVLPALPAPPGQVVMVFPGGRARLIAYKLRRDPRLAEALKGVHLLKFRHLRALGERPGLTPELWDGLLDADPPFFEEAEQMKLL